MMVMVMVAGDDLRSGRVLWNFEFLKTKFVKYSILVVVTATTPPLQSYTATTEWVWYSKGRAAEIKKLIRCQSRHFQCRLQLQRQLQLKVAMVEATENSGGLLVVHCRR